MVHSGSQDHKVGRTEMRDLGHRDQPVVPHRVHELGNVVDVAATGVPIVAEPVDPQQSFDILRAGPDSQRLRQPRRKSRSRSKTAGTHHKNGPKNKLMPTPTAKPPYTTRRLTGLEYARRVRSPLPFIYCRLKQSPGKYISTQATEPATTPTKKTHRQKPIARKRPVQAD